jgi:peroxiredoxin
MSLSKFFILAFLLFSTITVAMAQGFKITGKATGLKDNTRLYLRAHEPEVDIDSAVAIKGRFSFSGRIAGRAEEMILHTGDFKDYVFFWVENKPMNINVTAGRFKNGIISGSVTQRENNLLAASKLRITRKTDSLDKLLAKEKDTTIVGSLRKQQALLAAEDTKADINFVKNHPRSLVSANLLSIYASTWGKQTTVDLYKNFSAELKRSGYGINIKNFISLNADVKEGNRFVDFEQPNTRGELVKLSAIKAKYVLLDFWASWCGPCRGENPALAKTYAAFKDKGFAVLGVSLDDDKASWLKAIKDDGLTWENVSELNGDKNKAALIYGINGIPDNFLIDSGGIIIARNLRGDELAKKLQELMP